MAKAVAFRLGDRLLCHAEIVKASGLARCRDFRYVAPDALEFLLDPVGHNGCKFLFVLAHFAFWLCGRLTVRSSAPTRATRTFLAAQNVRLARWKKQQRPPLLLVLCHLLMQLTIMVRHSLRRMLFQRAKDGRSCTAVGRQRSGIPVRLTKPATYPRTAMAM